MSTNNGTDTMHGGSGAATRSKGNLQTMLSSYEQTQTQNLNTNNNNNSNTASDAVCFDGDGSSDISIQLDAIGRERSSTLGSFRDRGLTFGSVMDFDLDLGFGDNTAVPEGGVIEFATDATSSQSNGGIANHVGSSSSSARTNANANANANANGTSGNEAMNIVSANSSNASGFAAKNVISGMEMNLAHAQGQDQARTQAHYEQVPAHPAAAASASPYHARSSSVGNAEHVASMSASASASVSSSTNIPAANAKNETNSFFSGMFGTNAKDKSSTALLGHSPPSAMATSYEKRHFGKRMRAGVSLTQVGIRFSVSFLLSMIEGVHGIMPHTI